MQNIPDINITSFLSIPAEMLPSYAFVCVGEAGLHYFNVLSTFEKFTSFWISESTSTKDNKININEIEYLYEKLFDKAGLKKTIIVCGEASCRHMRTIIDGVAFNNDRTNIANINISVKSNITVLCLYKDKEELFDLAPLANIGVVRRIFAEKANKSNTDLDTYVYKSVLSYANYIKLQVSAEMYSCPGSTVVSKMNDSPVIVSSVVQFSEDTPTNLVESGSLLSVSTLLPDINIKTIVSLITLPEELKSSEEFNTVTFLGGLSGMLKQEGFSQYTQGVCYSEEQDHPQITIFCAGTLKAK